MLGSSLLFWAAVPLGAAAAALLARRAGWTSLPSVYLACFLVVALPVALVYQKYFDPFALLAVALFARPPDFREPLGLRRRGARCAPGRWRTRSASRDSDPPLAGLHRHGVDHEDERLVGADRGRRSPREP